MFAVFSETNEKKRKASAVAMPSSVSVKSVLLCNNLFIINKIFTKNYHISSQMSTEIKNHNKIQTKRLTWQTVCDIVTV